MDREQEKVGDMDEQAFRQFLKREGRSPSAIKRAVAFVKEYEGYLGARSSGKGLDEAGPEVLTAYVAWVERTVESSAKTHLWAIRYYYEWTGDGRMRQLAGELRAQRIKRKPFALGGFRGVDPSHVENLADLGIKNVEQMLQAGRTPRGRAELASQTGVPIESIVEFVKLSDLSRVGAVKSVRARLYHDAGVDTVEKMAQWDPEALRAMLIDFV